MAWSSGARSNGCWPRPRQRCSTRLFLLLFAALLAAHLCHTGIIWPEEALPLAAAGQILHGETLYRDIWFDKPPLLAWSYLTVGARTDVLLRAAGALYALLACWLAYRFASEMWGPREGRLAAALLAFFLTFYLPAAVVPVAADLLMLAPHLGAVWLAWRRQAFWSGALAGIAFLINPKSVLVLAVCAISGDIFRLAAGFLTPCALAAGWMWWHGSLEPYIEQVWKWGRIYAGQTFVADPVRNGVLRTLHWLGFHAALVVGSACFLARSQGPRRRWVAWTLVSFTAVALGWRFFPRYFFQLLPVAVLMAARGFELMGRRRALACALLLLVPLVRFGPRYLLLGRDLISGSPHQWSDTGMDRDSRDAARAVLAMAHHGDTLLVWGFRPEIYAYAKLPAATRFLDSQPLTGVPADRHLTESEPVTPDLARENRAEITRVHPSFIVDGLGPYNPQLAIGAFPDLQGWLSLYEVAGRTRETVIYRQR